MSTTNFDVLYQSSDSYAFPTGVSITSLCENNQDIDSMTIYLLSDGVADSNLSSIRVVCDRYGRELVVVETTALKRKVDGLDLPPFHGSLSPYYKLFAIDDIDFSSERVLYLDGDTIVDGSLRGLLETELEDGQVLAAVADLTLDEYKDVIGVPRNERYFNTGVMLIDRDRWRSMGCTATVVEHLASKRRKYIMADQDIINRLFRNNIKKIGVEYTLTAVFIPMGWTVLWISTG